MFRSLILREIAQVSRMTGVALHSNPRPHLIELYQKTLKEVEALPISSFYRSATTAITNERLQLVNQHEDVEKLVDAANCMQVEQLIMEANEELSLIEELKVLKPWEELQEKAPVGQWE